MKLDQNQLSFCKHCKIPHWWMSRGWKALPGMWFIWATGYYSHHLEILNVGYTV